MMPMIYCMHCGAKTYKEGSFCISCGKSLKGDHVTENDPSSNSMEHSLKDANDHSAMDSDEHSVTDAVSHVAEPSTLIAESSVMTVHPTDPFAKQPKRGLRIGILSAIGILMVAAFVFAYQKWIHKSPKDLYFFSEYKTYQAAPKQWITYSEINEKNEAVKQAVLEKPSSMNLVLSGNIDVEDSAETEFIQSLLKDSELKMSMDLDPIEEIFSAGISYYYDKDEVIGIELVQSDEQTAVRLPELYDDYIYLHNDDLGQFMKEVAPEYTGPEQIPSISELLREMMETESINEQWKEIAADYIQFIQDQLDESYFTVEKNVPYETPDGTKKLKEIQITLSSEQASELLNNLIEKIRKDDALIDLYIDYQFRNLDQLFAAFGRDAKKQFDELRKSEEDVMRRAIDELADELENITFPDGIQMTLAIDKRQQIIERNVNFTVSKKRAREEVKFTLTQKRWEDKDKKQTSSWNMELEIDDFTFMELAFHQTYTPRSDGYQNTLQGTIDLFDNDHNKIILMSLDLTSTRNNVSDHKFQLDTEFTILLEANDQLGTMEFEGEFQQILDHNLKEDYDKREMDLDIQSIIKVPGEDTIKFGVQLHVLNDIQFNQEVKFPSLKRGTDLLTLDEVDWMNMITEIQSNLEQVLSKHDIFQQLSELANDDDVDDFDFYDNDFYYDDTNFFDDYYDFDDTYLYEDFYFDDFDFDFYHEEELKALEEYLERSNELFNEKFELDPEMFEYLY